MTTYRVLEARRRLGITGDRLRYLIRKGVITPEKEGGRYAISEEDIESLRAHLLGNTKPIAAPILWQARSPFLVDVAKALANLGSTVWSAVPFNHLSPHGHSNGVSLLEALNFEDLAKRVEEIRHIRHLMRIETYPIYPDQYQRNPSVSEHPNLACIFVGVREDDFIPYVLGRLAAIPGIRRYGHMFGEIFECNIFVELRYTDQKDLEEIILHKILTIQGVEGQAAMLALHGYIYERAG